MEMTNETKIDALKKLYSEFRNLGEQSIFNISFSELYWDHRLGWDTYIKYFLLCQGLMRHLFVLTAFDSKRINSKTDYPNKSQVQSTYHTALANWENHPKIDISPYNKLKKPSELMLDLCCIDIDTKKMVLGVELEQSRASGEKKFDDIIFDFAKLLYIKSEFKIMISFPWQHQIESLNDKMKEIIFDENAEEENYLIVYISRYKNNESIPNRKTIDYELYGFILNNKNEVSPLEKCNCTCLWR